MEQIKIHKIPEFKVVNGVVEIPEWYRELLGIKDEDKVKIFKSDNQESPSHKDDGEIIEIKITDSSIKYGQIYIPNDKRHYFPEPKKEFNLRANNTVVRRYLGRTSIANMKPIFEKHKRNQRKAV